MTAHPRSAIVGTGKARYVSPNRGLALLDEAIEQIELQAKSGNSKWYQMNYRCGSGMCLAGWTGQLAGGEWLYPADSPMAGFMKAEPGDDSEYVIDGEIHDEIHVEDRATRLLQPDVNQDTCNELFEGDNSLDDIKRIRAGLA